MSNQVGGSPRSVVLIEPDPFKGLGEKFSDYVPTYNAKYYKSQPALSALDPRILDATQRHSVPYAYEPKPNTRAYGQVIDKNNRVLSVFNRPGRSYLDGAPKNTTALDLLGNASEYDGSEDRTHREMSAGEPTGLAWTDWILTSVQEERVEKTQVVETFGDNYLYVFGERPRAVSISGMLMNTADLNWRAVFWENWNNHFRATRLVARGARMFITYDDIVLVGYPMNASVPQSAEAPNAMPFMMTFFITDYINLSAKYNFEAAANKEVMVANASFQMGTAEFKTNRVSMLDYLGISAAGTDRIANELYEGNPELAGAVAYGLGELKRGTFAALSGEASLRAFLQATTIRTTYLGLRKATDWAIRELEDTNFGLNPFKDPSKEQLVRGEINAWFGFLSRIVNTIDSSSWPGVEGPGGAIGTALSVIGDATTGIFEYESIDMLVKAMAYNVGAAIADGVDTAVTGNANPGTMVSIPNRKFFI